MLQKVKLKAFCDHALQKIFLTQHRHFIKLPTFSNHIHFQDKAIVKCSPELIYNLVADVDNYYKFVPNVFESKIIRRPSPNTMEASLSIGIEKMISAEYTSTIHLREHESIIIQSQPNDFAKFIRSEWKFEPYKSYRRRGKATVPNDIDTEKCLVDFRVEFELYSHFTANILRMVLDDFTNKTMMAFIKRAEQMNSQTKL